MGSRFTPTEAEIEQFDRDGYVVFERVIDAAQVNRYRELLEPYLSSGKTGRNDFEGLSTNRVYAMLAKMPEFASMIGHPLPMAFVDHELGDSALLSACLAIRLHPGESVQPWHTDDGHINLPRPMANTHVSTFWALDDTTALNGATEIVPGSHRWSEFQQEGALSDASFKDTVQKGSAVDPGKRDDAIQICMPAGSVMITKGGLWHRGGANRSEKSRLLVTPQYCAGWARPLENMVLATPAEVVRELPERVQRLLGYSIHPPFMGYVDGMHPSRCLMNQEAFRQ